MYSLKGVLCVLIACAFSRSIHAQGFGRSELIHEWQFHLGDDANGKTGELKTGDWRPVIVPHDWSVELPPSPDKASCQGYLPGGIGWYRTTLEIPASQQGKRLYLYFEGVYNHSEVFVNGASVGYQPNGYVSFMYDVTEQVKPGGLNEVLVRVDHSDDADSRWYTGSGIYRPVHLVVAEQMHIGRWGVYWTAELDESGAAIVTVETTVENSLGRTGKVMVAQKLLDADGVLVADTNAALTVNAKSSAPSKLLLGVENPRLWNVDKPYLYTLDTTVSQDGKVIDQSTTRVGIRTLTFDPDQGFALNGEWMKIKGVCVHHDAGVLGAAVPKEVWRKRLEILKEIGCNGIRMSHNPHLPALYDLCDEMGFLVMDEAFDEWEYEKKKWIKGWNRGKPGFQGPADFFEEWGERDLASVVKRDRNHPSVIMWSIGNEVDYPNDPYTHPILNKNGIDQPHVSGEMSEQPPAERLGVLAKRLAAVVRSMDRSRPVTAALAGAVMSNETDYPGALDVVGYNYTENRYQMDHEKYPERVLYGSETRHNLGAWNAVTDNEFIFGQFIWTGFDYLGEAGAWPSRGFTSGMVDMAHNLNPRGYFRRALWSTEPVAYVGTHVVRTGGRFANRASADAGQSWNYEEGQNIRVVCYTNGDEAELLLNGNVSGERKSMDERSRIIYWDVPYQPGELTVVAYQDDEEVATDSIMTAGEPKTVKATMKEQVLGGEYDIAIIPVTVVDAAGVLARQADNEVVCTVSGPGKLLGLENATNDVLENLRDNTAAVNRGRLTAYVQATADSGTIEVSFTSPELEPATLLLRIGK